MTPKQKLAVLLRRAQCDDREVAERLGITRENANRLINRGLRNEAALLNAARQMLRPR
ncbi:MAG TPA: hypothetical protein VK797_23395 [Tepidisphaeraceae bacterium]|nr:hypothetical protein [Tepidisphaeraceae bacterium]